MPIIGVRVVFGELQIMFLIPKLREDAHKKVVSGRTTKVRVGPLRSGPVRLPPISVTHIVHIINVFILHKLKALFAIIFG